MLSFAKNSCSYKYLTPLFYPLLVILTLPTKVSAQQYYEPLEDIPMLTDGSGTSATSAIKVGGDNSLPIFANNVVQIMIGVAIVAAVIMIIYGGVTYMTTGSFTEKGKAKDRITQAFLGLLLALSSVLLLNSINPNLTRLNSLENVNVEEETNPLEMTSTNPDEGIYFCYESDRFSDSPMDLFCNTDQNICETAKEEDEYSQSGCNEYLFFEGASSQITSRTDDRCFAYTELSDKKLDCYVDMSTCGSEQSDATSTGSTILASCQSPEGFGSDSVVDFNDYLEEYITSSSTASNPEVSARENYVESRDSLGINKAPCASVTVPSCTNVGGMSDETWNNIIALKNAYVEPRDDCGGFMGCYVEISGGTSWWFHGDQKNDPFNNGSTCHNPIGLDSENPETDLCTGAVDFSSIGSDDEFNTFMEGLIDDDPGSDSGCVELDGQKHWILDERDANHWHVEFGDPTGECSE